MTAVDNTNRTCWQFLRLSNNHHHVRICGQKSSKTCINRDLLFLAQKVLAFFKISGIITTNLGKTATQAKIAGREKTDTSLQNIPFSLTGEGYFFVRSIYN